MAIGWKKGSAQETFYRRLTIMSWSLLTFNLQLRLRDYSVYKYKVAIISRVLLKMCLSAQQTMHSIYKKRKVDPLGQMEKIIENFT